MRHRLQGSAKADEAVLDVLRVHIPTSEVSAASDELRMWLDLSSDPENDPNYSVSQMGGSFVIVMDWCESSLSEAMRTLRIAGHDLSAVKQIAWVS